ncbi:uncharacterized protein AB675_4568 [Cyphellophora attinorum]|uniref:BZIP domain-containing protein n=1 Tax=Cyphellophora attinorum TaxID=1664694 RepID=A0A0N0NLE3_9EURO|nr:uncharacterized protein AB675_4568 [Phialophora attinorum]KPI39078.1 hypothetical protein AB675_4568 [Phialophora attinorum]
MQSYSNSGPASTASVSDLDGYTLPFNAYTPLESDEFGFDPPTDKSAYPKMDQAYSPPEPADSSMWPEFQREDQQKQTHSSYEIDKLISQNLPNATNAISRFGQVTPPRTNSTDSVDRIPDSSKESSFADKKKRMSRTQAKEQSAEAAGTSTGRKRKASRKAAATTTMSEPLGGPGDEKRRASLEKNRLAAAKCRVNKKEKTEQLQRDSHDMAIQNSFLKQQLLQISDELQQIRAHAIAHISSKGCKGPEEIQKRLQLSGNLLSGQMQPSGLNGAAYAEYRSMDLDAMQGMAQQLIPDSYFPGPDAQGSMLNPPLPDFEGSAEFDAHTPMKIDCDT